MCESLTKFVARTGIRRRHSEKEKIGEMGIGKVVIGKAKIGEAEIGEVVIGKAGDV